MEYLYSAHGRDSKVTYREIKSQVKGKLTDKEISKFEYLAKTGSCRKMNNIIRECMRNNWEGIRMTQEEERLYNKLQQLKRKGLQENINRLKRM